MLRRRWAKVALAAVLYGAAAVLMARTIGVRASPPPIAAQADQQVYRAMADHPFSGDPNVRRAPWCWRVLPALIVKASGLGPDRGFRALTIASLAALPAIMMVLVLSLGTSASTAILIGGFATLLPPIVAYMAWAPAMTDGFAVAAIACAAWATVARRRMLLTIFLIGLALSKETWALSAAFAILWTWTFDRRSTAAVVSAVAIAALANVSVRFAIHPSEPYSTLETVKALYLPLSARNVLRRLLLATGATWNVLTPILALSLARLRCRGAAFAIAATIALAMLQPLVATETERPVAAAAPFVLIACAMEFERWPRALRLAAGSALLLAQIPWLLSFGYVDRLPLRSVEIAIVIVSLTAIPWGWGRAPSYGVQHAPAGVPSHISAEDH